MPWVACVAPTGLEAPSRCPRYPTSATPPVAREMTDRSSGDGTVGRGAPRAVGAAGGLNTSTDWNCRCSIRVRPSPGGWCDGTPDHAHHHQGQALPGRAAPARGRHLAYNAQVYNAQLEEKRQNAGTFDTPEEAVAACQKALGVLSDGPSITVAAVHGAGWSPGARPGTSATRFATPRTPPTASWTPTAPGAAITKAMAEDWVQAHPWHYGALQAMFNFGVDRLDALPSSPFRGKRPRVPRARGARSPSPSC